LEKSYENEKEINLKKKQEINKSEISRSTAAIKFEDAAKKNYAKKDSKTDKLDDHNNEKISQTVSIYMEVTAILPHITLDKTMLNFWECKLHERKYIEIRITNKNEELPIDFCFTKVTLYLKIMDISKMYLFFIMLKNYITSLFLCMEVARILERSKK